MALIVIFLLGIANFALHQTVLESGHPLLRRVPGVAHRAGRRVMLLTEFFVLLGAMLLAANGWPAVASGYSAMNAIAAWLIVSRRI